MLNVRADDARWMMLLGVGMLLTLAMLAVADAAWAKVFRNGRWGNERSLRGQLATT